MSRRSTAARRKKALARQRIPTSSHPQPLSQAEMPRQATERQTSGPLGQGPRDIPMRSAEPAPTPAPEPFAAAGAQAYSEQPAQRENPAQERVDPPETGVPLDGVDGDDSDHDTMDEGGMEPQWPMLASAPALVEALTRSTGPRTPPRARAAQAQRSRREGTRATTMDPPLLIPAGHVFTGPDGLMDSWPGDVSSLARWWWRTRQYLGRLFADLRQGRLHWPRAVQPRIILGLLCALGIVAVAAGVGFVLVLGHPGAFSVPNLFGGSGPAAQPTSGIVLQTDQGGPTATTARAPFVVTTWVSNSAPPTSGQVQVFVRVTNTTQFTPQPGVSVSISVAFTCAFPNTVQGYGPAATNSSGLAAFTVSFSGLPVGQPVCITATARANGQTYTSTATFAPSGGGRASSSPTPINPQPTPTHKPKH